MWVVLQSRVPFRLLFIRVPYYIGDLKRDPNLENYPCLVASAEPRRPCGKLFGGTPVLGL